ncbi:MAG TPA: NTP transferase domain-containing protein [Thermoanaerobaculia bacterium]|nr:NTP transferase domain-containing protein [Thermoanaerobaculia bacterium]
MEAITPGLQGTPPGAQARAAPVAIVPAAGTASRLGRLAGSKELLPIGFERRPDGSSRPRPAIAYLLDGLAAAGVERVLVALRAGKWDLPAYLADGAERGMALAYVVLEHSPHVLATVAAALPWTEGREVALGFPDILFRPADAYARILARLRTTDAELVLGLFPTGQCEKTDMVELGPEGRPVALAIKQPDRGLRYTWSIAAWSPGFSRWLAAFAAGAPRDREVHFGEAIQAAIERGRRVEAVVFDDGDYLDVGTADDLERAMRRALR